MNVKRYEVNIREIIFQPQKNKGLHKALNKGGIAFNSPKYIKRVYKRLIILLLTKYKNRRGGIIVHETATYQMTVELKLLQVPLRPSTMNKSPCILYYQNIIKKYVQQNL